MSEDFTNKNKERIILEKSRLIITEILVDVLGFVFTPFQKDQTTINTEAYMLQPENVIFKKSPSKYGSIKNTKSQKTTSPTLSSSTPKRRTPKSI